jgi:hypothetical protein
MMTLSCVCRLDITTCRYKGLPQEYVMHCYGFLDKWSPLAVLRFSTQTKHDTLPIAFLISKQDIPYWTRGDTCCPRVSTPKIRSLADLSTTCHDAINHLHHSNHCSNHNIDPHHSQLTSRRMGDQLSQGHKPNLTSQRMRDLHDSHNCMAKQY